jgi:hypothetical protein
LEWGGALGWLDLSIVYKIKNLCGSRVCVSRFPGLGDTRGACEHRHVHGVYPHFYTSELELWVAFASSEPDLFSGGVRGGCIIGALE